MAQNSRKEEYRMKMYQAQIDAIQKQKEIEKLREEMADLRRKLREQRPNDFIHSQGPSYIDMETIQSPNQKNKKNNVRELSEKGGDKSIDTSSKNYRAFQKRMEKRNAVEKFEMKLNAMKNELSERNALCHSVNCLIIETIESLKILKNKRILQKSIQQILVIGGFDGGNYSSNIFLLDYNEKIWKRLSIELPYKVSGHGTAILEDELYIIGGYDGGLDIYCSTLYRLTKQMKWEKLTDMREQRASITNSCISHNGCIWVIGGCSGYCTSSNTMEKYDPTTNQWEKKPAMKRPRLLAAAAVINNKLFVCGGSDSSFSDSIEVFDIDSEVWTDFCTIPGSKLSMSIVVDEMSIILIGGYPSTENAVWKMDVEKENEKWINLPPLNEGRDESSAVRIETGCILVFGGKIETNDDELDQASYTTEIFNGQKWEIFTSLPEPRRGHTSVVLTTAMIDSFRPFVLEK